MLCLFASFIASVYVPFSTTSAPGVRIIGKNVPNDEHLFVLGLEEGDKLYKKYLKHMRDLLIVFDGKASFAVFETETATKFAEKKKTRLPCIYYFSSGVHCGSFLYPQTDNALLYLIESIVEEGPKEDVRTLSQLLPMLGSTMFNLFVTKKKVNEAVMVRNAVGGKLGVINIIQMTKELLNSFGIDENKLGFFRRDDLYTVPVSTNLREVFRATVPAYKILKNIDLNNQKKIVFALIDNTLKRSYKEVMFEVGLRFPQFLVGFVGPQLKAVVERTTNENYYHSPSVAVFNVDKNIHYNATDFFGDLYNQPFFVEKWINAACKMLNQLDQGKISPIFVSEEIPPVSGTNVQKLVGKTYEDYINDPEKDVVVLYKRDGCVHCKEFFPKFLDFAKECADANVNTVKFGYIDIIRNSGKVPFPYMRGVPHVHIFPAKNKTDDSPIRGGNERSTLIYLINRYGSYKVPFEQPPLDKEAIAIELMEMIMNQEKIPPDVHMKNMLYMQEISPMLEEKRDEL